MSPPKPRLLGFDPRRSIIDGALPLIVLLLEKPGLNSPPGKNGIVVRHCPIFRTGKGHRFLYNVPPVIDRLSVSYTSHVPFVPTSTLSSPKLFPGSHFFPTPPAGFSLFHSTFLHENLPTSSPGYLRQKAEKMETGNWEPNSIVPPSTFSPLLRRATLIRCLFPPWGRAGLCRIEQRTNYSCYLLSFIPYAVKSSPATKKSLDAGLDRLSRPPLGPRERNAPLLMICFCFS